MGKAASKVTQALGFGGKSGANGPDGPLSSQEPKPPQWDTTIDQLFGDAPPDDNVLAPTPDFGDSIGPKPRRKRRRAPPPPPSMLAMSGRRRRLPSSPSSRRRNRRGGVHAMQTPIVADIPRQVAKPARIHATNAPMGRHRRAVVIPNTVIQSEMPTLIKRQGSIRRRRQSSSQRNQRLQDLLQCPVCLNPYIQPRLLPCGHTYCLQCLNRLISEDRDVIACPVCRKEHLVPEDGVFAPNFIVQSLLEPGSIDLDRFVKRSSGKTIQFYVAVRKVTRSHSQVKRLTIEMPMGNYLRDTCETLIRRIVDRELLDSSFHQYVLEFGDKRLRPQRTLASYGVQNGDLLFLFSPEQRLNFLAFDDDRSLPSTTTATRGNSSRLRTSSGNSSTSDIRTATSIDLNSHRHHRMSPIADQDDQTSSVYSDF